MKTIKTMIKDTKKKAFTLIELLIVVAIIGILAGVGIPMYNGYMANARVESSNTNHNNVRSFIAATLTRCSSGAATVNINNANVACNDTALPTAFETYFNVINNNPYDSSDAAVSIKLTGTPALGETSLVVTGSLYSVSTNIGDADRGDVIEGPVVIGRE